MKPRPLWPLLLPVAAMVAVVVCIQLARWFENFGMVCGVKQLTGLHCPGCGGTRCAIAMTRGEFYQAWGHNAMLAAATITFALVSLYLIIRIAVLGKSCPKLASIHPRWFWAGIGAMLIFTILRNTSTFACFAP